MVLFFISKLRQGKGVKAGRNIKQVEVEEY